MTTVTDAGRSIEKEPVRRDAFVRDRRPVSRARLGLRHLLANMQTTQGDLVLLPAYVGRSPIEGSGIMDPIHELGRDHAFYRVRDDLSVDLADFHVRLADPRVSAALIVHFFGAPQPDTREIAAACEARGVPLIEDCAHCFASRLDGRPVGDLGDFALFSIHKVLAADGGGILQVNRGAPVVAEVPHSEAGDPGDFRSWARADFEVIACRRLENYRLLVSTIDGIPGIRRFWPVLPEGTVPLNLPVIIERHDRFALYRWLRSRGVGAVSLYHTLVDGIDPARYPVSHDVSARILNLPIHQDIEPDQIPVIAELLERGMAQA